GRTGFTISASTPGMSLSDFPADVSRITARSCSAAPDRMAAATAAPSISGIIRSTIATSNGSSLPAARRISRRASWPLSKLRPRMPHEATYRSRIVRLVRLSSMIATVVPPRGALDFGRWDLAKPARVSDHDVRYIGSLVQDELDALVHCRLREQLDRLLDHVSRAELHGLQPHAAGLDPREVKDVVDDLEQRIARDADRLHVLLLLGCEPGIHQQTRHADDTAQRSSDLVAHRGQNFGFQARLLLRVL